jgi:hypothetical protein
MDPAREQEFMRNLNGDQRYALQQKFDEALRAEYIERVGELPAQLHVTQIKGKQNSPLAPKYQKYAQDFVQTGTWDSVKDAEYAGLLSSPKGYMTTQEMADLFESLPDNARNTGFVQERIDQLKSSADPNYDYYGAYLYAKQTF